MNKIDNANESKKEKQKKIVNEETRNLAIQKGVNRMNMVPPIIVYLLFLGTLVVLLCYQSNSIIAAIIDFVIAALSIAIMLLSCIKDEKKIYIWVGSVTVLLMTVFFVLLIIIGMKFEIPSNVSRIISCIGLLGTFAIQLKENLRIDHKFYVENENKKRAEIVRIQQSDKMEYRVSEFCHVDKKLRKDSLRLFFKIQYLDFVVSYIFIFLSSGVPVFSINNAALWVFLWYTISIVISWYMYINQYEYNLAVSRANRFDKKHASVNVEKRSRFSGEIGGWNFKSAQFMGAVVVALVLGVYSFVMQSINYSYYMQNYKEFCVGLFVDTYVLAFFTIYKAFILEIEEISGLKNKMTYFLHTFQGGRIKNILIHSVSVVIVIGAMGYYFSNEFASLFGNNCLKKVIGTVYILYMLDIPKFVKELIMRVVKFVSADK